MIPFHVRREPMAVNRRSASGESMKTPDPTGDQEDPDVEDFGFGSSGHRKEAELFGSSGHRKEVELFGSSGHDPGVGRRDDSSGLGRPGWESYGRLGFCIWRFDGATWHVVTSKCTGGAVCGRPPKGAGSYEGEHRKKFCEPEPGP
jgi:hypothetical protein